VFLIGQITSWPENASVSHALRRIFWERELENPIFVTSTRKEERKKSEISVKNTMKSEESQQT
jgi:hypothetical protein